MEELKMIIAGNIGQLRRDAGITQLDLAEHLNYSDKAVSKWERGESIPDIVTLKAIADRFSVSVDYLLRADHPLETEVKCEYTKRQRRNHRRRRGGRCGWHRTRYSRRRRRCHRRGPERE